MKFCDEKIQEHLLKGEKIKRESCDFLMFLNNNGLLCYQSDSCVHTCCINNKDLTVDDWKIVEPEYDWDKIIKDKVLCVFCNNDSDNYAIGHLVKVLNNSCHKFVSETYADNEMRGIHWNYCKPFNPADFNIAKDLKEYEK